MKIEKNKHDHKLTHLLKVVIFAMLMIAPLFASCSQLMYVTFNKNAYQSTQITGTEYYTTYEYETNEVNSVDDLIEGNIYKVHLENTNLQSLPTDYRFIEYTKIYNLIIEVQGPVVINLDADLDMITSGSYFGFYTINGDLIINTIKPNGESNGSLFYYPLNITFDYYVYIIYKGNAKDVFIDNISASDYLGEKTVNERPVQALDNAFYYGVEKMTESPLFNWTQNTALYTGIKAMTDNLQVQTNVIAVLVTYWTILTIIYIIIDIVLALFTKMTHLLVRSD